VQDIRYSTRKSGPVLYLLGINEMLKADVYQNSLIYGSLPLAIGSNYPICHTA